MYLSFYGLVEKPFSITPDPRYLYLSGRHAEALAHLVYGIDEAGGFIQLTGEVGTGKTTIIRSLLARQPDKAEIALILNPRMAAAEFMLTLCEELGILVPDTAETSVKDLIDILNRYLLRAHSEGRRVVLVVDEAQTLAPELLEQVRLLTNLETETQKLLQIILIGQPELRELLARNDLRQLAQRITGRYHLDPLSRDETSSYIKHRLRIAGATNDIFTHSALNELYRVSGGVPRLLNIIADRALLGGFSSDRHLVGPDLVRRAAAEVYGRRVLPAWLPWVMGGVSLVVVAAAVLLAWPHSEDHPAAAAAAVNPVTAPAAVPVAMPTAASAPMAAPASLPVATADLPGALAAPQARTSPDDAWWRLLQLWQARYVSSGEDACTQALRQGLECLAQRGSLATLRGYNRPAILTLRSGAQTHAVVMTRLDNSSAQPGHADRAAGGLAGAVERRFCAAVEARQPRHPAAVAGHAGRARAPAARPTGALAGGAGRQGWQRLLRRNAAITRAPVPAAQRAAGRWHRRLADPGHARCRAAATGYAGPDPPARRALNVPDPRRAQKVRARTQPAHRPWPA